MQNKVCIVTGANAGIGKVTAIELARQGATVVMICRSQERGEAALADIQAQSGSDQVELLLADLSAQADIHRVADEFKQRYDRLDVLVNNAGGIFMERKTSVDGLELTFALNHMGYFLLTDLLLDMLKASAPARIVSVSSGAHRFGDLDLDDLQNEKRYKGFRAYGQSKLANILFTKELARQLEGTQVTANVLHPGFVKTQFGQRNSTSGLMRVLIYRVIWPLFAISPEQGAETSIYLANSPEVADVTGEYFEKKKISKVSKQANDMDVARQLWAKSQELLIS